MLSLVPYITKVVIISGAMYGYYWIALRNKKFHQFNRFYLLSAVILPLVLPFVNLQFLFSAENKAIPVVFSHDIVMDNIVIYANSGTFWSKENILNGIYLMVAAVLFTLLLISIIRIVRLNKKGQVTRTQGIILVNTKSKGTPFSFFNRVFWNPEVDLRSADGIKMLNHELIHCRQLHSVDKLLIRIVCTVFWFNPFFWMIKSEVNLVHEFLADKLSFKDDSSAFSKIILEGIYPGYNFSVANNFFYSPIKRRIMMLLKNNHQKVNYIGRLLVLPLLALLFIFFSTRAKAIADDVYQNLAVIDTIPNKDVTSLDVITPGGLPKVVIKDAKGNKETLSMEKAVARGLKIPPPPPPPPPPIEIKVKKVQNPPAYAKKSGQMQVTQIIPGYALYILDGKKVDAQEVEKLSTNKIKVISVLKGESAYAKYGHDGLNGVVEIYTKNVNPFSSNGESENVYPPNYTDTVPRSLDKIFTKTEVEAQFPGGNVAWRKYITGILQQHLSELGENDYGTCILKFIVDTKGNVSNVEATNMQGTELAEIAVEAIRKGPKWIPAQQNGHYVNAYRLQPVTLVNPHQ